MKHIITLLTLCVLCCAPAHAAEKKRLKVFVLAGQSNMQGHAKVSTFEHIGMDPATKPMLAEFHYLGSAKILGGIGKGLAMAELLNKQNK